MFCIRSAMPYVSIFIAMPYVIRVNDLTVRDVVSMKCLCGAGPWTVAPHWFRSRHHEATHLRHVLDAMRCPACGSVGGLTWQTFRAEPPR